MKSLYEPTAVVEPSRQASPQKTDSWDVLRWQQFWVLGMLAGGILACNFATVPLMDFFRPSDWGAPLVYFCFGVIPLQCLVLAAYLAWGPGPFWLRLALHWGAATVALIVYVSGFIASGNASELDEVVEYSPLLLAISVAVQVPLWATRFGLGWRLVPDESSHELAPERNLAIRDLMTGTLIVAVVLGAVRASPDPDVSKDWAVVGLIMAGAIAASTFVWLPVASWILGSTRPARGMVFTGLYAIAAVPVVWGGVHFIDPISNAGEIWDMLGVTVSILAHGGVLIVAGGLVRIAGWRLVTGRPSPPHHFEFPEG